MGADSKVGDDNSFVEAISSIAEIARTPSEFNGEGVSGDDRAP